MTPSLIREAIVRRAAWSKTWSYVLRVALSFCLVRSASTWDSRCRMRRSSITSEKRTARSTKSFLGSEDVDRLGDDAATGHVAGLGLRVSVLDVALLVLELPDLDDEEVPLADPHPLLQLPRDPTEPALPVCAHDAYPGRAEQLVRNPENLAVFRARHPDADDLFFHHSRIDGEGWLKHLRGPSLREIDGVRDERPILRPGLADGRIRKRNGRRLEERRAHDVDPFRQGVRLIVHVPEPVDDGPVPEQVAVRLELFLDVPPDFVGVAERGLRFDPVLPGTVHLEGFVEEDVGSLVVLRSEVLLRFVFKAAGVQPCVKFRLPPSTAGILPGRPPGRVHDVGSIDLVELAAQAPILDRVDVVDHLPEILAGDPTLFQDHEGGEDRGEVETPRDLEEARPVLPHEGQPTGLRLHSIELLRRVSDDPLGVDHEQEFRVVAEVFGQESDVLPRPHPSVAVRLSNYSHL